MFYAESLPPPFTLASGRTGCLLLALVVSSWVSVGFLSFSLVLVCGARKPCTFILPAMRAATIFFVGANPKRRKFNQVSVIKHAIGLHGLLKLAFFLFFFFFFVFFSKVFGPFVIVPGPAIEILRRPFSLRRPFARMRPASASLHAAEKKGERHSVALLRCVRVERTVWESETARYARPRSF